MANSGLQSHYTVMIRLSNQSTDHSKEDTNTNELVKCDHVEFIGVSVLFAVISRLI